MPSGLRLSVVSNFIDQMVTGDSEICKESFLLLFSGEQMWGETTQIFCILRPSRPQSDFLTPVAQY